ncbi:MAG: hypothetical protein KA369_08260 [Spirochaetes bacterium]|nr:hypothetical protein [Spirochaetota bacterium]
MNLLEIAERDLEHTLEANGVPVILIDGDGTRYGTDGKLKAQTTDIGFFIDPGSGVGVRGRTAEVNFRLSTLIRIGADIPDKKGWMIESTDIAGNPWTFAVEEALVDRTVGVVKITVGVVNVG